MLKLCAVILIGCIYLGRADIMYEMQTDYQGMLGIADGQVAVQVFIKGDKARISVSTDVDRETTNVVTIIRFDLNKFWVLDEINNKYDEITFDDSPPVNTAETHLITEITVDKTGDKKTLLDQECEKIIVSMRDSTGGSFFSLAETLWVSNEVPAYQELKHFTSRLTEKGLKLTMGSTDANENALREFQKKINEIDGFPLEFSLDMQIGVEDLNFYMRAVSRVTKLDEVPIHDRVFDLPEGYTKRNTSKAVRE